MAINNRLKLSRDQLGLFLQNHEQIKQFEKLFSVVDEVSENSDTQGTAIGAANAQASANEALAQIEALKQIIGLATEAENKAIQALDALDQLKTMIDVSFEVENKAIQALDSIDRLQNSLNTIKKSDDPIELNNLPDVLISLLAENHIIQWDAAISRWKNTGTPKFGSATDYTGFEADGTMVAIGLARTWVDVDFPIIIRTSGTGIPTLATLKGNITVPQWQVGDLNVCEGQELIHAWLEGSTIYWHVHVITNGLNATNRYLRFEIEWVFANIGDVLSATITDTSVDLLIPANTTDRTHLVFNISNRLMTGNRIGTHVYARLRRVAAVGSAPTNDPFCSMLQLHVETDTTGSRQIATK